MEVGVSKGPVKGKVTKAQKSAERTAGDGKQAGTEAGVTQHRESSTKQQAEH